jgi:phosphoglycolate phosphatase-like HAD superfamily hydrolase
MGPFEVVLTDFERTLVRMFKDGAIEQEFLKEVWKECKDRGVPTRVLRAGGESPYSLWRKAHRWMTRRKALDPYDKKALDAYKMYTKVARIAIKYELDAAESIRLFDDVPPVLEQLKTAGIPVVIVSNNAARAVERVLERNDAKRLVDHVIGRAWEYELIGNLKPRPLLVERALQVSGRTAATALLVGDSVDDMKAGKKAKIGFRVGLLQHSPNSKWQLRRAGANLILSKFGDLEGLLFGGDVSGVR